MTGAAPPAPVRPNPIRVRHAHVIAATHPDGMRFVLLHGAYHGAWCWERLAAELETRGHEVVAPDLPGDDPDAGADAYAQAALAAMTGPPEPAVIVGHSLGGLTTPVLATRTPTRRMVFLCAILPIVGLSFDGQDTALMDSGFRPSESPVANPDGSASWPHKGAIESYYHDCPREVAEAAARRLRPQHWRITQEVTPLEAWPAIPSSCIVARDDRALSPDWCRRIARDRLGVEAVDIEGGHSPFLSRPETLATLLVELGANHG
jgi:pimeloyl-ACP methyl ester carboxylesterase